MSDKYVEEFAAEFPRHFINALHQHGKFDRILEWTSSFGDPVIHQHKKYGHACAESRVSRISLLQHTTRWHAERMARSLIEETGKVDTLVVMPFWMSKCMAGLDYWLLVDTYLFRKVEEREPVPT
jgi:hypothetical protein